MSAHVTALIRFFQLRQLRPFVRLLTTAKILVQAFISCRLNHCNSLLHGVTENVMRRVQSLQNAAARLITGARRRVTTLRRSYVSCTDFLLSGEWSSNSPVWSARHCAVKCLRRTYKLIIRVINFELVQPICPRYVNVTDRRTDRRTQGVF